MGCTGPAPAEDERGCVASEALGLGLPSYTLPGLGALEAQKDGQEPSESFLVGEFGLGPLGEAVSAWG